MARPQENQRLETRHVGAKTSISCETSSNFHTCSFKIAVCLRVFLKPENLQPQNRCFVRGFCQFSSHLAKCNVCHGICTLSPLDAALAMRFAKSTQHLKVLCLPRQNDDGHVQSAAPATKTATHLLKTSPKYCACHTKRLSTRYETQLSRSATPATRNEATRRWKPANVTPVAKLAIGTAIRASRERLWTAANGWEQSRHVERTHPQPPDP